MKRVLVTGPTGAVGPGVVRAFLEAGWQVDALLRRKDTAGSLPDGCQPHVADVFDGRGLAEAVARAGVVVHLAGLLHVIDAPDSLAGEYVRVNVEGTKKVLEAARAAGVRRVVLASTIAVYGPTHGRMLDETEPPRPDTHYASSKLTSEQMVLADKHVNGTPRGVVLRLAAVYGGRVKGNYEKLVRALDRGRFIPVGRGENRRTLIHEQDAARAFVLAADHPDASGRVFNVTDREVHTVAAITDAICKGLGRRSPRWVLPSGAARAAAVPLEALFTILGRRSPLSRLSLAKYLEDVEVSGAAIERDLGFSPQWNLEAGWANAIEEMRRLERI